MQNKMKKLMLMAICAMAMTTGCKQQGQKAPAEAATDSTSAEPTAKADAAPAKPLTPEQIANAWKESPVKVKGGGQRPDIVTLCKAFNQAWPSDVMQLLLDEAKDPKFTQLTDENTGGGIECDRKNGYASVVAGDSDLDCMEAAVWQRENGHRLLMVNLVTPKPDYRNLPEKQALCVYDYDPKTETMTPEENVVSQFKSQKDGVSLMYRLPKNGTELSIGEGTTQPNARWHFFEWDGMKFAETISYTEEELDEKIIGAWMCKDKDEPLLTFVIADSEYYGPQVEDCAIYGSTEYEAYASTWDGYLTISDSGDIEEQTAPAIKCRFRLTPQGELTGTYYLRQNGGKELRGTMTMKHGNPAW